MYDIRTHLSWLVTAICLLSACSPLAATNSADAGPLKPNFGAPLTPAPPGSWQTFGSADGLPAANIADLAVDSTGGIWVATGKGAAFFDGRSWQAYTTIHGLPGIPVMTASIGGDESVWLGGENWVSRYSDGTWTHFTGQDGLQKGFVVEMTKGQNSGIWVGVTGAGDDWAFGNGAARFSPDPDNLSEWRIQSYPPTRERMGGGLVSAIAQVDTYGVWFAVNPEGTHRPDIGTTSVWRLRGWETVAEQDDQWEQLAAPFSAGEVLSAMEPGPQGELWVGTSKGLLRIPPESVKAFTLDNTRLVTTDMGLPANRILSLAVSLDGSVAAGTEAGLAIITKEGIEVYSMANGLPHNTIRAVGFSKKGEIWVGTPSGVSVLRLN
jgi:hypothetical protein